MSRARTETSVARVLNEDGRPVGAAFLAAGGHVVTCAHVVNTALGSVRALASPPDRDALVRLVFPFSESDTRQHRARVLHWSPGPVWRSETDLAVLELVDGPPAGVPELAVTARAEPSGTPVQMCGSSAAEAVHGLRHVLGEIVGLNGRRRWQVNPSSGNAASVTRGFSGGPVWRRDTGEVLGVVRAVTEHGRMVECLGLEGLGGHIAENTSFHRSWTGREPLGDFGDWNRLYLWFTVIASVLWFALGVLAAGEWGVWGRFLPFGMVLLCFGALWGQARARAAGIQKRMAAWTLRITWDAIGASGPNVSHDVPWDRVTDVMVGAVKADPGYLGSAVWPFRLEGLHVRLRPPGILDDNSPAGWPSPGGEPTVRSDGWVPVCVLGPMTASERKALLDVLVRRIERSSAASAGADERAAGEPGVSVRISGHAPVLIGRILVTVLVAGLWLAYAGYRIDLWLAAMGLAWLGSMLGLGAFFAIFAFSVWAWDARAYTVGVAADAITAGSRRRPATLPRAHLESIEILATGRMRLLVVKTAAKAPFVPRAARFHVAALRGYVLCDLVREDPATVEALDKALRTHFREIYRPDPES